MNIILDRVVKCCGSLAGAACPAIRRWKQAVEQQVYRDWQVRTSYGRRRHLPQVRSTTKATKQQALRQAVNTIIQGTDADINKLAPVRLRRTLPDCSDILHRAHGDLAVYHLAIEDVRQLSREYTFRSCRFRPRRASSRLLIGDSQVPRPIP
jgi:hypothetical protein